MGIAYIGVIYRSSLPAIGNDWHYSIIWVQSDLGLEVSGEKIPADE